MAEPIGGATAAIVAALEAEEGRLTRRKAALAAAAVSCFAENGYAATSTRQIAARAGTAEATLFRHFGTKQALLLRITEPVLKRLLVPAAEEEAAVIAASGGGGGLRGFARAIMLSRIAFADRHLPLVRVLLAEMPVNAALRGLVETHVGGVLGRIVAARGSLFPPGVDGARLLRVLMSMLAGYYLTRTLIAPGDWDDSAEVDAMLAMLFDGVDRT